MIFSSTDAIWLNKTAFDTLACFALELPVTLTCNASQYGLGAACLQTTNDGNFKPISYASRTLIDTEQHYAQIEKELLAVVFACTKFKDIIFGLSVTIETDHQLLVTILNKPIHAAPARLQRMMMQPQQFDFNIVYKKGRGMHIADTLSRALRKTNEQQLSEQDQFSVMKVLFVPTD